VNPREQVLAAVTQALPDTIRVLEHAQEIDPPKRTTVMVRMGQQRPLPASPQYARLYQAQLLVMASRLERAPADDDLEDAVELILWSIDHSSVPIVWTEARPRTWVQSDGNQYPGFEIDVELGMSITDPTEE
jgi:hypothetical protein